MAGPPPVLGFAFICILLSIILLAIGFVLRRRGKLQGPKTIGWIVLSLLPLGVSALHSITAPATGEVPRAGSEDAAAPPTTDLGKEK
jgi:hypothetical protein